MRLSYLQNHYNVVETSDGYEFITNNGVVYLISFILYPIISENIITSFYAVNIDRCSPKTGQHDEKVMNTVAYVIDTFFQEHNDALIAVTDISDKRQAARKRLFDRWFNDLNENLRKLEGTVNIDDTEVYVSLLYRQEHFESAEIISVFKDLIDNNLFY